VTGRSGVKNQKTAGENEPTRRGRKMPLRIAEVNGQYRPVVICDHCGQSIEDALDGNYEWKIGGDEEDVDEQIYFTHKRCCHAFEQRHRGDSYDWGATELTVFPLYLGNSLHLDWDKAWKQAALLANLE
jgi:hypothetical protein